MFEILLKGAAIGFSISILAIGPSFFVLIQTSIKNGFRSAVVMAMGISLSDITLVVCAYLGAQSLLENPRYKIYEGFIGSAILLGFGIVTLFQKHEEGTGAEKAYEAVSNIKRMPLMFIKGYFLNLLNPFVLFLWVGYLATVSHICNSSKEVVAMIISTLVIIFTLDVSKSLAANRIKKLITPKLLKWVHYIMGIALIVCGIILLYNVLSGKAPHSA